MAVDPQRFSPGVSGIDLRRRLGLLDCFVIGWTDLLPGNVGRGETFDLADFLDAGMADDGPLL